MGEHRLVILARVLLVASALGLASLHWLEPSYDPSQRTLSEYALSASALMFTLALLALAAGSALVLRAVWADWHRRRWLVLVWVVGTVVVAFVPTDPGGGPSTATGLVHGLCATAGIGSLLLAEVASAIGDSRVRVASAAAATIGLVGLAASPIIGFGWAERIVVGVHIAWLLAVSYAEPARSASHRIPAAVAA